MMASMIIAAAASVSAATPYDALFEQASEAYRAGEYETAAYLFEQLVAEGVVETALFHNLGNSYYQLGQPGAAIANYHRALQLSPFRQSTARNLDTALGQAGRGLGAPGSTTFVDTAYPWLSVVAPAQINLALLAGWIMFWAIMADWFWRPARGAAVAAVVAFAAVAYLAGGAWLKANPPEIAVVNVEEAPVRYGVDESQDVRFVLYEGDRVLIDGWAEDWVRVNTRHGERGWTQSDQLVFIGPPYRPGPAAAGEGVAL